MIYRHDKNYKLQNKFETNPINKIQEEPKPIQSNKMGGSNAQSLYTHIHWRTYKKKSKFTRNQLYQKNLTDANR